MRSIILISILFFCVIITGCSLIDKIFGNDDPEQTITVTETQESILEGYLFAPAGGLPKVLGKISTKSSKLNFKSKVSPPAGLLPLTNATVTVGSFQGTTDADGYFSVKGTFSDVVTVTVNHVSGSFYIAYFTKLYQSNRILIEVDTNGDITITGGENIDIDAMASDKIEIEQLCQNWFTALGTNNTDNVLNYSTSDSEAKTTMQTFLDNYLYDGVVFSASQLKRLDDVDFISSTKAIVHADYYAEFSTDEDLDGNDNFEYGRVIFLATKENNSWKIHGGGGAASVAKYIRLKTDSVSTFISSVIHVNDNDLSASLLLANSSTEILSRPGNYTIELNKALSDNSQALPGTHILTVNTFTSDWGTFKILEEVRTDPYYANNVLTTVTNVIPATGSNIASTETISWTKPANVTVDGYFIYVEKTGFYKETRLDGNATQFTFKGGVLNAGTYDVYIYACDGGKTKRVNWTSGVKLTYTVL